MRITKGGCLCGAVKYEVHGDLRPVVACHCNQCRKTSGHYVAATQAELKDVTIWGDTLKWFHSSESAKRGFCSNCGSNLFWQGFGRPHISIWAGTIEGPTKLKMESQLYPEEAGDYYDLPDIPAVEQSSLRLPITASDRDMPGDSLRPGLIHMLCRFDLKPGVDEVSFQRAYLRFATLLEAEGLILEASPIGRRELNTPMDTDRVDARKYYAIMSFRDRERLDAAYARFVKSMAGHEAVLAGICNSVFNCWRNLDQVA